MFGCVSFQFLTGSKCLQEQELDLTPTRNTLKYVQFGVSIFQKKKLISYLLYKAAVRHPFVCLDPHVFSDTAVGPQPHLARICG